MPSPFRFRERFRARVSRSSSPAPTTLAPPPTGMPTPASNSSSLVASRPPTPNLLPTPNNLPISSSLPSPVPSLILPNGQLMPTENPAFVQALKNHMGSLSPEEQQAFDNCKDITPDTLVAQVKIYDDTHNNSSYARKYISRIEGFLTAVDAYLKPLSVMIGHSPEISSLVVGGAKLVVQLGLRFANFFNKLTEMMEHLSGHLNYLSQYAKCFEQSNKVQEALSDAYGDLLEFFSGVRRVFVDNKGKDSRWVSFRVFLTVTWDPFEERFDSLLARFRNHVEIVVRTASVTEYQRLRSEKLLGDEEKKDQDRYKLLSWLSKLDFDDYHETIFSKRHQNTGNWLVESPEFKQWEGSRGSSLLWCYGGPGVGKTVLASLVLEVISAKYTLDSRIGIAFAYFNFQNEETQNPATIISTMIKQLARQKKTLPSSLTQFYKTYHRDAKFPTQEKLKAQLLEVSKAFDQVFLIVDAMDEFENRKEFLPTISRLIQDSSIMCKVFVASRKETDIEASFNQCGSSIIQIEAKKVDTDIAAFVRHEVEHRTKSSRIRINQNLREKIIDTLTSKSNGMFLWVIYQLDFIYSQPSARDIDNALDTLPDDMDSTYIRILKRIDRQVPARRELGQRVLMWVICAKRPLKPDEIRIAVSMHPDLTTLQDLEMYDAETLIETCCNLIVLENGVFRPFHYTVQEFFTAERPGLIGSIDYSLFQKYRTTINDQERLAETCLRYFLLLDISDDGDGDGGLFIHSKFTETHKLSGYAAGFWHRHVWDPRKMPESLAHCISMIFDNKHRLTLLCLYRLIIFSDINSISPLDYCISLDILPIFQSLHQFDIKAIDLEDNRYTLFYAAEGGSASIIKSLLEIGYPVDILDGDGRTPLHIAAQFGHEEASLVLLENGADVNAQGGLHGNALQAASDSGALEIVQLLLDRGANVNAQGGKYGNALQAAAAAGKLEIVQLFLGRGANVNAQGGKYDSALQAAATIGNLEILQLLLDREADVNAQGGEYGNALQAAVEKGSLEVVQLLLDRGADVNSQGGYYGNALQKAVVDGYLEIVRLLLDRGADVNAQGGKHGNALQAAAVVSDLEVVQLLLDRGADVNAQGGEYGNALQAAVAYPGSLEVVQLLLDRGADVNAQGGEYGNALQAAAAYSGSLEIVQLLLGRGADVNTQGGEYGNALQAAVAAGDLEIVQLLLDRDADVSAQGGKYGNALQAAAITGKLEIMQLFLDRGADVNAQSGYYSHALQAAAAKGHFEIVQLLLARGADVNAQGGFHSNALQAASARSKLEIVRLLLDRGADVNAQGGYYGSPLQSAAAHGQLEIAQLLLDRGADLNAQGGYYGNALQTAATTGNLEIVRLFLDRGADVNAEGGHHTNALQSATAKRKLEIVRLLLDRGAYVNAQGGHYGNPLQSAAANRELEMVQLLLDRGADVNAQGGYFGNALQAAAAYPGSLEVVQLLLDRGADVNAQGGRHGNALTAAKMLNRSAILDLLVDAGARSL